MTSKSETPTSRASTRPPASLVYLYGVTAPGTVAAALLRAGRVPGIEPGALLFPVEAAGLVAAVSRVPAAVFDEGPLNELAGDLARLTPYALRHEEAVRALSTSALVPMTFGAVYRSPEGVAAMLDERAAELRAILARVQGREEWGLKVIGRLAQLLAAAEAESDELRRLAAEAATATPGRAYLISRKRDNLRAQEASRLAGAMLAGIMARLAPLAAEVAEDDPGPAQPGDERLLLKSAFLVEAGVATAFGAAVAELERAYAPRGLTLEVTGPWAPYSFVRLPGGGRG